MYHAFFNTVWRFTISESQSYILITKNTHQLNLEGKKNVILLFLANKNFGKDKYGNRPLDKDIGRVMIKILHSLNVQFKMNIVKSTQSIMLLRGFFIWYKLLKY